MRILNDVKETKTWKIKCDCGVELEIEESDIKYDNYLGLGYCNCPRCNQKIEEDFFPEMKLNVDNIKYPEHFYDFSNGKELDDKEINEEIKTLISHLDLDKDFDVSWWGCGNTNIDVKWIKDDKEISIIVSKGYKESSIFLD